MVDMSTLLAAVVEEMENTGKDYEDVEAAVCNLKYNVRECNNEFYTIDELRVMRNLLDKSPLMVYNKDRK